MILSFPLIPVEKKKNLSLKNDDNAFKILFRIIKIKCGDKNIYVLM